MMDITMTATVRPNIVAQTLDSFCKNLFKDTSNFRLIINIDPVGERDKTQVDVLNVAKNFFTHVVYNFPLKPSFPKAVMWCWHQVNPDTDFFFHLEDDWIILREARIDHMVKIMKKHPHLAALRLNKFSSHPTAKDNERCYFYDAKLSLNPSLMRVSFVKGVLPLMTEKENPEKQLRKGPTERGQFVAKWNFGVYLGSGSSALVQDIGRPWLERSPFQRQTGFLVWQKKV
jgi:hypothetical protein